MDPVREACKILKQVLQARAPYKTGNLAINSIRIVGNKVVIGGEIAPYASFTNEPWNNGKKNPNEGWIQRAIEEALPLIKKVLDGRATEEDVIEARKLYQSEIAKRKKALIEAIKKIKESI